MSKIEEILQEILQNQRKISDELLQQRKIIQNIEERLKKIETESSEISKESHIPTSLIRVLKGLSEEDRPVSAEDAAKRINLSRNLTSGYLNRLADLGYVIKEPNLEGRGARYLFRINYSAIPDHIKQVLRKYNR
ncbi:MAG: helix-turn-helix domain-containing protein [candidate division WOR-3 bacterium]